MNEEILQKDLINETRNTLNKLGVDSSNLGYTYIVSFICHKYQHRNEIDKIKITYLYSIIAKEFNTTYSRVERAIRWVVSKIDLNDDYVRDILQDTTVLSNGNVINLIYNYVIKCLYDEDVGNDSVILNAIFNRLSDISSQLNLLTEEISDIKKIINRYEE